MELAHYKLKIIIVIIIYGAHWEALGVTSVSVPLRGFYVTRKHERLRRGLKLA